MPPRAYADLFDHRAWSYHAAMRRWPRARDAELRAVASRLGVSAGARVLDAPAGGGYLAPHLPPDVRLVGVEPSRAFYERLHEAPDLEVHHAPLDRLPLASGSVDAAACLAGLHHIDDQPAVFAELARVVRPGGRVVVADVEAGSAPAGFLDGFVDAHASLGHVGRYLGAHTAGELEGVGLRVVEDAVVTYAWSFPDPVAAGTYLGLLFGIDEADPRDIAEAAEAALGRVDADGFCVAWGLRFVVGVCPGADAAPQGGPPR